MKNAGANVISVEPDKVACNYAIENEILSKDDVYNCSIQEMPKELDEKFDLITIFLFLIPRSDHETVFKRVSELLKPEGKLVIGTELQDYIKYPKYDKDDFSLRPVLEKYFDNLKLNLSPTSIDDNPNKYVFICSDPKRHTLNEMHNLKL